MSRTSSELAQEVLCSNLLYSPFSLSPLECSRSAFIDQLRATRLLTVTGHREPGSLSGVLESSNSHLMLRILENTQCFHSWVLSAQNRLPTKVWAEFQCLNCPAYLVARLYASIFSKSDWEMFDLDAIHARHVSAEISDVPSQLTCVYALYHYLQQAMHGSHREIVNSVKNRARLDLDILARKFGWGYNPKANAYTPPLQADERLYERAMDELALFAQKIEFPDVGAKQFGVHPAEDITAELFSLLGSSALAAVPLSRPYACLGCASFESDDTLFDQYQISTNRDPRNVPYYLDALQQVAETRGSEFLLIKVSELVSLGIVSLTQIRQAYQELGFSEQDLHGEVDEEVILDLYIQKLRQYPEQSTQLSEALGKVADFRDSQMLQRAAAASRLSYEDSLKAVGVDYSVPDQTVAKRISSLLEGGSLVLKVEIQRALRMIATHRKSPLLLSQYEKLFPEPAVPAGLAYDALGISPHMEDKDILTAFTIASNDEAADRQLELRRNLRAIAEDRESAFLGAYLETGKAEAENGGLDFPVGLWNIGNTCYLNSLLQFYYTVTPLRDLITDSDPSKLQTEEGIDQKKVGGRLVPFPEVKRSQQFMQALGKLFEEMASTKDRFVVPNEELAYMALIPPKEDVEEEARRKEEESKNSEQSTEEQAEKEPPSEQVVDLITPEPDEDPGLGLSSVDASVEPASQSAEPMEVEEPTGYSKDKFQLVLQRQQDVTECIENVLFQIEASLKGDGHDEEGEQQDLIKDLFYGQVSQTLQKLDGTNKRVKKELISSIMLNVAEGPQDIYVALDAYFSSDTIELSEGAMQRSVTLKRLPPVLQIQIQRVQFDRTTYQVFKNLSPLIFDETIYLDRYMDTEDPEMLQKRQEMTDWRAREVQLRERLEYFEELQPNKYTRIQNLSTCTDYLKNWVLENADAKNLEEVTKALKDVEDTLEQFRAEQQDLTVQLEELKLKMSKQYDQYRQHGYRIHSLFIHRGQVNYGHYWIYIRDFKTGNFLKYNDETVQIVQPEEVFDNSEGNTATPYYLVFIREDFVDRMESIHRVVTCAEQPPPYLDATTNADASDSSQNPGEESMEDSTLIDLTNDE